jgi:hypothetical protein
MKITISVETEPSESTKAIADFLREAADKLETCGNAMGDKAKEPEPRGRMGFRATPVPQVDLGASEGEDRMPTYEGEED